MKIIYQNILPPKNFIAIMLFGYIFARKKYKPLSQRTVNHELIHAAQAKDCGGWILFYIRYLYQWIKADFKYSEIPFEKEAHENDDNLVYLINRPKNSWKEYI
jgi:hypothetical protein